MIGYLYFQIETNDAISRIYIDIKLICFLLFYFLQIFYYLAAKSQCAIFMDSRYFIPDAIWIIKLKRLP